MTARVLKLELPTVFRYAAIFWAFYELFIVVVVAFHYRGIRAGSLVEITLNALASGAINIVLTLLLFGALDVLSAHSARRFTELAALFVIIIAAVLLMILGDAVLGLVFDGVRRGELGAYSLGLLRTEFHDALTLVTFLAGLANALRSWAGEDERKIRKLELRTAIARAELEAVAAHLRPAAVAEALEEIGEVVEREPARARELTLRLADSLRASFRRERSR